MFTVSFFSSYPVFQFLPMFHIAQDISDALKIVTYLTEPSMVKCFS